MIENYFNRCQYMVRGNQCLLTAAEESRYCDKHKSTDVLPLNLNEKRNFRLTKWQARMEEFADNSKVKSLREEIGIMRILLEETLNKCHTSTDLLLHTGKISDIIVKIEKLVVSCNRLELSTGLLIDKSAIINLAQNIIVIIGKHIQDQDDLTTIADEITDAILKQNNMTLEMDEVKK